jgi:ribosome recycling factor
MNDWKPRMQKTVSHLAEQLAGIRQEATDAAVAEIDRLVKRKCETSRAQIESGTVGKKRKTVRC